MDEAPKLTSCASQGDSRRLTRLANSTINSSNSSDSDSDEKALYHEEFDKSDDSFGIDALPRDRESLEHELAQLDELDRRLQNETATDFKLGCILLMDTRQERVVKAHAALKRRQTAARRVFEYASEKAREAYASRCAELQKEMNADIERELRRLQTAKDGVSVTSRRRRAVRDEARGNVFTPAKTPGIGMRRRRTMYTSDGDANGPEDVFLAAASPEEKAHRVQFQEKKRLERLLGCASVFEPVAKQVTAEEIAEDLKTIQSAVSSNEETRVIKFETKEKVKLQHKQRHKQKHQLKKKCQQKKKPKRQRPMIITPRRIPRASGSNLPASATSFHGMASTAIKNRRPRLLYNPHMLQEGQEIEVFKRQKAEMVADKAGGSQDKCVMSGIVTAATTTLVYVLTSTGRFESFDVRDCVVGSLYVRAAENNNNRTDSVRNNVNSSST